MPSIIQKLFDSRRLRFHLMICGSSQRMMQGLVLDSTAPLYGRAREILKIRPLEPGWLTEALALSPEAAVAAYSVWGGVPRYWELARNCVARLTIGGKRWKTASRWWGKAGKGLEMEIDVVAESLDGTAAALNPDSRSPAA